MRYVQMIFSPTGGTSAAAAAVTGIWPNVETIDLSQMGSHSYHFSNEDLVLIAMPSFGGLAPQAILDRLADSEGNGARCVLMAVYGNRAIDDTLVQMEDTVEAKGFRVIAAISAVAQHSMLPQYAAGRPDAQDAVQLKGFSEKILEKAAANDCGKPKLPGNRPYKKPGGGMVPKAGSACTACGLCAQKCPMGAIDVQNPKLTDKNKCIGCMRCVAICPTHARSISKVMAGIAAIALKKSCFDRKENVLYI